MEHIRPEEGGGAGLLLISTFLRGSPAGEEVSSQACSATHPVPRFLVLVLLLEARKKS